MSDFAQFLKDKASVKAGGKPLFTPGIYDEVGTNVWTKKDSFVPVDIQVIQTKESELGVKLPTGYVTFMQTLGPGLWADAFVLHPDQIYALGPDSGGMAGWLMLAANCDGCGNNININPADSTGAIYYCCHDPFGYAVTAPDFEVWIKAITDCFIERPGNGTKIYYDSVSGFVEIEAPVDTTRSKAWWQFW